MQNDYILLDEGDAVLAYLGIQVGCKKTSDGLEFKLTLPALIKRIIVSVLLKDQCLQDTPALPFFRRVVHLGRPAFTNILPLEAR
jgi:hypothetical protein